MLPGEIFQFDSTVYQEKSVLVKVHRGRKQDGTPDFTASAMPGWDWAATDAAGDNKCFLKWYVIFSSPAALTATNQPSIGEKCYQTRTGETRYAIVLPLAHASITHTERASRAQAAEPLSPRERDATLRESGGRESARKESDAAWFSRMSASPCLAAEEMAVRWWVKKERVE